MRRYIILLLLFAHLAVSGQTRREQILQTHQDSIDYFYGLILGYELRGNEFVVDFAKMMEGMVHALEQRSVTDQALSQEIYKSLIDSSFAMADPTLSEGQKFLLENGQREGVITTSSGLQYEVIQEGDGPKPTRMNIVSVHYEGKMVDGSIFDSSFDRGEPIQIALRKVIEGWQEGLCLMSPGAEYMLYIPAEMGYGSRSSGPIPAYSTLIFRVQLIDILQ